MLAMQSSTVHAAGTKYLPADSAVDGVEYAMGKAALGV